MTIVRREIDVARAAASEGLTVRMVVRNGAASSDRRNSHGCFVSLIEHARRIRQSWLVRGRRDYTCTLLKLYASGSQPRRERMVQQCSFEDISVFSDELDHSHNVCGTRAGAGAHQLVTPRVVMVL